MNFLFTHIYHFFKNTLLKASPNEEHSNLALSRTPGFYPKSSPVNYSYLSSSLDDNADNLAAFLFNHVELDLFSSCHQEF